MNVGVGTAAVISLGLADAAHQHEVFTAELAYSRQRLFRFAAAAELKQYRSQCAGTCITLGRL